MPQAPTSCQYSYNPKPRMSEDDTSLKRHLNPPPVLSFLNAHPFLFNLLPVTPSLLSLSCDLFSPTALPAPYDRTDSFIMAMVFLSR